MNNKYSSQGQIMEDIQRLGRKYTALSNNEIEYLINYANNLELGPEYQKHDVFIDVWNPIANEAIVVWHRKPFQSKSIYKEKIVGRIALRKDEPGPIRTLLTGQPSMNLFAVSQEGVSIKQTAYPIHYQDKVLGVIIFEEEYFDEMDSKHTEREQVDLTTLQRVTSHTIFDELDEIIMIFNPTGKLVYYNREAQKFYKEIGYLNPIHDLNYDNLALDFSRFNKIKQLEDGEVKQSEVVFWKFYLSKKIYKDNMGNFVQILNNKTKQKETEMIIEKELVTVQEIHHRVKNNLQTIVSLLRLQARRTDSQEAQKALDESINRVLSIATTHELLSTKKVDTINLKEVINSIVSNLLYSFASKKYVQIIKEIEATIDLDFDLAVPVGLIINEIVQNSLEHAFVGLDPSAKEFEVRIKIVEEDGLIRMNISDNGIGFDKKKVFKHNLGLQIVTSFVESKLNGLIVFEPNNPGTFVRINFKNTTSKVKRVI